MCHPTNRARYTRPNSGWSTKWTESHPTVRINKKFWEEQISFFSEFESYVATDGQSASLSWNKAPIWGLRPDFYYCQTAAGLLLWGALSDDRKGLSFTISAGPRQRNHSGVRVPWDSRQYFTVSDLSLLFLSPPTTLRATVEVFNPASHRIPTFL
jgi:hypothetical protein